METFALMKRFRHYCSLQVYMLDFIYIDSETIPEEEYLPYTRTFSMTKIKGQLMENYQGIELDSVKFVQKL